MMSKWSGQKDQPTKNDILQRPECRGEGAPQNNAGSQLKNFLNSMGFQGNLYRKFMYSTVHEKNVKQISSIILNGKQRDAHEKLLSIAENL